MNIYKIIRSLLFTVLTITGAGYIHHTWKSSINETIENSLKIGKTVGRALNGETIKQLRAVPDDEKIQHIKV